jgi:hypothetical protein
MRPVLYADIVAAASVVRCVEREGRSQLLDGLIDRAHCADKFRKRSSRWCPGFGDGSLVAACAGLPRQTGEFFSDSDYAECMRQVFEAILRWRARQQLRGNTATSLSAFGARETKR